MLRTLMRLSLIPLLLVTVLAHGQRQPHFTEVFSKAEFAQRRAKLAKAIGPHAIAIVKGNEGMRSYKEFRQNNNLFYLTGVEAPQAILIVDGGTGKSTLFLPPKDEHRESVEGPLLVPDDYAKAVTGVDEVSVVSAFTSGLGSYTSIRDTAYIPMAPQELEAMSRDLAVRYNLERIADPWDGRESREAHFVSLVQQRFPTFVVRDLTPTLDKLRLVKSAEEIAVLRKSAELSAVALAEAMRSTQPGQYEYELDALAQFIYFRNGAQGLAYYALVADGTNAYMPHYHAGLSQLKNGDLLLMDFAPDYHYYMADVTRMWPVDGTFSAEQRELYSFYLKCYQAIMKHIRPGVSPKTIMLEAAADMDRALASTKFSKDYFHTAAAGFVADYRAGTESPYGARLGHWVGMSTHDVGGVVEVLEPGMVFTIEPQFRVPEDETYIRLEDVLLVTETGVENLSAMVPMEIKEIEELVQQQGLLERYPRLLAHDAVRPVGMSASKAPAQ